MVQTDFGALAVRLGGNDQKPAMVFWPSLMLDASMWHHQVAHYAPDYRIILIDPPGIGASAPLRRPISVADSVTCLRQILDALAIRTSIVIGSSWGALVAACFAADHPERLQAAIVTNGTAAPPTPEVTAQMTGLVAALEHCETAPDWLLPAVQQGFAGTTAERDKPEFMAYLGQVLQEDPVSLANAMKGILLGREDLHPVMRRIRDVPVLIIAGAEDRIFDLDQSKSLAAAITGSEFVLLPETGHLAPTENPVAVNAAIDAFLAERLRTIA